MRNMPEIEILARKTKKIRTDLNESQEEFSANCDISVEILSMLERGLSNPRLSTLQKIAAYTGFTVADLLSPENDDTGGENNAGML